jgi:anaerobic selenocysteine-containing dehydrogenase
VLGLDRIETASLLRSVRQGADLHLQIRIGTNIAVMNGLIHLLIAKGWINRDFIDRYTVGFQALKNIVREYPPEQVSKICGIGTTELEKAAEWIGTTERMVSTVLQASIRMWRQRHQLRS